MLRNGVEIREVAGAVREEVRAAIGRKNADDPIRREIVEGQVALAYRRTVYDVGLQSQDLLEADASMIRAAAHGDLLDGRDRLLYLRAVQGPVLAEAGDHLVDAAGGDDVGDSCAPCGDDSGRLLVHRRLLPAEGDGHRVLAIAHRGHAAVAGRRLATRRVAGGTASQHHCSDCHDGEEWQGASHLFSSPFVRVRAFVWSLRCCLVIVL